MATVEVEIGGRKYPVSCRDGEEAHLREVAALLDKRAQDALDALGSLSEARLLLFSALMIADDLHEARRDRAPVVPPLDLASPLERLADRVEEMAERLEKSAPSA